ncbi:hypothetical protein G6O69_29800 [Pseudenhygromyxa sp. WMMC2535]|uniref:hypothetical protein n=1 Tax=Pseudenhygromyxa sp. WMMC2535 TaxID=2712867 RepID=UPI0015546A91|nr:hypothetical protein [Pseudenhygromyxa sp. WMMC2535]NVB42056.1 hypothetical protein [Pseudenhygromyxa sp. WMMC2535]
MPHPRRPAGAKAPRCSLVPALALGATIWTIPALAEASPGVANRLSGAHAQGPATASVTGIYHNPAMLGALPGLNFQTTLRTGVDHLSVRRFAIDSDGAPTDSLGERIDLANPAFDYFIGASFLLDPIAIGAAVHTFDGRYRYASDSALSYHLAPEDDIGCTFDSSRICPQVRQGGALELRTDFDLSLAWNALDFMSVGATLHFPRQRTYLARDIDSALTSSDEGCDASVDGVENPDCAERLSFRGSTKLRWFGLRDSPSSRLDFALTVGVAFAIRDRLTVGIRYRTQPLLEGGTITLNGEAVVCSDDTEDDSLPTCESASAIAATLTETLPRELAVGIAGGIGNWQLDANLYWIDRCPGSEKGGGCDDRDGRQLELVGLDQSASTLSETTIYRGLRDVYGAELWARYRLDDLVGANLPYYKVLCSGPTIDPTTGKRMRCVPRVDLLLGAGFNSPAVDPDSLTAASSDGWTVLASIGTSFNLPGRSGTWSLVPAYGLDLSLPTRVGPGGRTPAYDPTDAVAFEASGGDINHASAEAVLAGRAQPTNAALYVGAVHTIIFSVRWSERGIGARELPARR